jgi:tetratricopeptide (TPR) repeat protein
MSRIAKISTGFLLGLALLGSATGFTSAAGARALQAAGQSQAPGYGPDAYKFFNDCKAMTDPNQELGCLDKWMTTFSKTDPGLLFYVYVEYFKAYPMVKDYPKAVDACDKLLSLPNLDPITHYQVLLSRAQNFMSGIKTKELSTPAAIGAARDAARQGLKDWDTLKKPDATSQADWDKSRRDGTGYLWSVVAQTSSMLKDLPAVVEAYKAILALDPNDGTSYYAIGNAYLQMTPPQTLDGFWNIARAISLKVQGEAAVRTYLKNLVQRYQGGLVQCDPLIDQEVNQMIALAAGSPDRPASFTLPTGEDLQKAQQDTANFIPYLREGGDHGKLMWLAVCGLEYTDFVSKIIAVDLPAADAQPDAPVVLHLFTGATKEETDAGTTANMEVKIVGQPDAKRAQAGDELRFTATLTTYDPTPFMLHWDKGKLGHPEEDLPQEKGKTPPKKKGGPK